MAMKKPKSSSGAKPSICERDFPISKPDTKMEPPSALAGTLSQPAISLCNRSNFAGAGVQTHLQSWQASQSS